MKRTTPKTKTKYGELESEYIFDQDDYERNYAGTGMAIVIICLSVVGMVVYTIVRSLFEKFR
jgi:hypothetical protein